MSKGNKHDSTFSEKGLHLVKSCPVCKVEYKSIDVILVDKYSDTELVHITCSTCLSVMKVMVSGSAVGMSVLGMLTDLTADDARNMLNNSDISDDDVLTLHQLLNHDVDLFHSFLGM